MRLVWVSPLIIMAFLVAACNQISDRVFDSRMKEGIIEYSISFPDMSDESITATLLPETMTYAFTENSFASYFDAAGGMFKNRVQADRADMSVEHHLKVFKKKIKVIMNDSEVMKMLAEFPKFTFITTEDTATIAGVMCKKALMISERVDSPEVSIYYTNAIRMNSPNWCTQYHEIDGVLMVYDIEQFGIRMHLEAKSIKSEPVQDIINQKADDFETISREAMNIELEQLVETFEL